MQLTICHTGFLEDSASVKGEIEVEDKELKVDDLA